MQFSSTEAVYRFLKTKSEEDALKRNGKLDNKKSVETKARTSN